ncbi:MAG: shikimate kinase [Aquificaceae bacterium]|nr:shikimate kinase [Aquificaceae bacterium]MDW8236814.1 shikimate kinase [Aquificaceae bacterium]
MKESKIFLIGFMCSGKSSLASKLSRALRWRHVDTDREIEKLTGKAIAQIFKQEGEAFFRQLELNVLSEIAKHEKIVVSTGGGLGANKEALKIMLSSGFVVWLKIDFETFISRCFQTNRPLLSLSKDELRELMIKRNETYKLAHLTLDASKTLNELASELLHCLDGVCNVNELGSN